jgi:RNA polymerase sigma factor (sigma-70 family)
VIFSSGKKQVLCQTASLHQSLLVDELAAKRSRPHQVHPCLYRQVSVSGHAKPTWRWMSGPGRSKSIPCWHDWRTVGALLRMECRIREQNASRANFAAQLSPTLRRTFPLRDLDGLSISETARILGIPSGTVKAQLARARAKLREAMRRSLERRTRVASMARK